MDPEAGTSGPRGSRIKDHGSCFGTKEHPRRDTRDTDVIVRQSKALIEIFNSRQVSWLNSCSEYSFMTKQRIYKNFWARFVMEQIVLFFDLLFRSMDRTRRAAGQEPEGGRTRRLARQDPEDQGTKIGSWIKDKDQG